MDFILLCGLSAKAKRGSVSAPRSRKASRRYISRACSHAAPRPKRDAEEDEHGERSRRRHHPYAVPVVNNLEALVSCRGGIGAGRIRERVTINDRARDKRADEVAQAIGHEVDEALWSGADFFSGTLIGVDLAADEEEVVAH